MNAAECLLAATTCQGDYRGLLVSIAASWHALARHDEAIEKLLVSWEATEPARRTGQVFAFRPTSPAVGSICRRDPLCAGGQQRRLPAAELVILGECRAGLQPKRRINL
jgi:hypothetical protein